MQTKCPIFLIYISMAVLLALCTVPLFAVGYPLSRYEYRSWKESVRPISVVNDIKDKTSFSFECLGQLCQQHDKLLRGRGPPVSHSCHCCGCPPEWWAMQSRMLWSQ